MKLHPQSHCARGITLIECLVYIAVLGVMFSMGLAAYHRCIDHSSSLRRNTNDITQALSAGEYWRADLRAAIQPPRFDETEQTLHITQTKGEVAYRFSDHQILRRAATNASWSVLLPRVQQSEMIHDSRSEVIAWRWELELMSYREPATFRPLFTFIAATARP